MFGETQLTILKILIFESRGEEDLHILVVGLVALVVQFYYLLSCDGVLTHIYIHKQVLNIIES